MVVTLTSESRPSPITTVCGCGEFSWRIVTYGVPGRCRSVLML